RRGGAQLDDAVRAGRVAVRQLAGDPLRVVQDGGEVGEADRVTGELPGAAAAGDGGGQAGAQFLGRGQLDRVAQVLRQVRVAGGQDRVGFVEPADAELEAEPAAVGAEVEEQGLTDQRVPVSGPPAADDRLRGPDHRGRR